MCLAQPGQTPHCGLCSQGSETLRMHCLADKDPKKKKKKAHDKHKSRPCGFESEAKKWHDGEVKVEQGFSQNGSIV
jgi:hypothetical protein